MPTIFPDGGGRKEFYTMVGRCIKTWANVEDAVFKLCEFALQAPRKQVAIVYFRTPALDARLELTSELMLSVLPQRTRQSGGHDHPDVKRWNTLIADIKSLLPTRNMLAHAPVVEKVHVDISLSTLESWIKIALSEHEKLRGRKITMGSAIIGVAEMQSHHKAVIALVNRLNDFYTDARARHAKFSPNSSGQSQD
jgi:hypothetical protein